MAAAALAQSAARGGDQHDNDPNNSNTPTPSSVTSDNQQDPQAYLQNVNSEGSDTSDTKDQDSNSKGIGSMNPRNQVPGWGKSW